MTQSTKLFTSFLVMVDIQAFAEPVKSAEENSTLRGLLIPAVIAVGGYIAKSLYEIYLDRRKKRLQSVEEKLKYFYWPVLLRLEKDNAIWETLFAKEQEQNTLHYKLANSVERNNILKNHQEILDIIDSYIYLAEPDELLIIEVKTYIKHVTIYKALREAGVEDKFPFELGAIWPSNFFKLIKERTEHYQVTLNKFTF